MRSLLTVLLLTSSAIAGAQHLRVEPEFGYMHITQTGAVIVAEDAHTPALFHTTQDVANEYYSLSWGLNCWYSLNFGTSEFESFAYGIESGVVITAGSQDQSVEAPKKSHDWNWRFPVMFGVRFGSSIDRHHGKLGFGLSAGLEYFRTALPNESGVYVLPKVNMLFGLKRLFFGLHFYPVPMTSVYEIDGTTQDRLRTSVFEYSVRTAFNWTPKKYRVSVKRRSRGY